MNKQRVQMGYQGFREMRTSLRENLPARHHKFGHQGGNHSDAISTRFTCGKRQNIFVSILSFKLLQVELVRVFLTSNLGQNLLVVVITQCPTKFLVGHVSSAIPFTPKPCHVVGAYDNELPVSPLPGHD